MEIEEVTFSGTVRKYIPWNRTTNTGGYGFLVGDDDGLEYFFNAKFCVLVDEEFSPGLAVCFQVRIGLDRKTNQFTKQATKVARK